MMRKLLFMILFLILISATATYAEQSYVAVDEASDGAILPVVNEFVPLVRSAPAVSTKGGTITVQRVNSYKYLRDYDHVQIEKYLASYKKHLHLRNYEALRVGLPQIVGNGTVDARDNNGKLILNQSPAHYLALIQSYYGVAEGTDWYVNLPGFTPGGSQGPLTLCEVPGCTGGGGCGTSCVAPGALQASHPGDRMESTVAAGWISSKNIDQQQPKPPGPECPGVDPPNKPPTSAPLHDQTGLEPNGAPASGGPPTPTGAQAPVQIGNGTVPVPTPMHANVADPATH